MTIDLDVTEIPFPWGDMRQDALAVISSHERGHGHAGLATQCAYHLMAVLDAIGIDGCDPASVTAFVDAEQEYSPAMPH